jgi:hypothetical protein
MYEDPIVKEARKLRDEYASQFHYDLNLIFIDLNKKRKIKIIKPEKITPSDLKTLKI